MNPTALITGASRGIGRGIALELASLGYDLIINFASNQTAANQAVDACLQAATTAGHNIRAVSFRADVSESDQRNALVGFARAQFDSLTLLVNNAGVAPLVRADLLDASEESFDRLIRINVKGPYFLTQAIARWMIERPSSSGPGAVPETADGGEQAPSRPAGPRPKIVTISSISAYTASPNRGDYCVAKAALSMLTPLYAERLAEHGINVYEIRPGIIATDMTGSVHERYDSLIAGGLTPIRRWGQPQDVGKAVAAIAQDLLPFSTGEVLNVDGGFHLRRL